MIGKLWKLGAVSVFLVLAGCGSKSKETVSPPAMQTVRSYTCPMHQEVNFDNPNEKCPRCGMALVERSLITGKR